MKILPQCDQTLGKKLAKKVGLNKIKTKDWYSLHKVGQKNASPYGYGETMACGMGNVFCACKDNYIWIVLLGTGWFKTSPVLKCEPIQNGFKLETENSYYELRKC